MSFRLKHQNDSLRCNDDYNKTADFPCLLLRHSGDTLGGKLRMGGVSKVFCVYTNVGHIRGR